MLNYCQILFLRKKGIVYLFQAEYSSLGTVPKQFNNFKNSEISIAVDSS